MRSMVEGEDAMRLNGSKCGTRNARRLRREMTLPEILLWQTLKDRPDGLRFRKQHPAGDYVLDFYCPAMRLAIEVDGEAHERGDRPAADARRDAWLAGQGVTVVRISAVEILSNLEGVVSYIREIART